MHGEPKPITEPIPFTAPPGPGPVHAPALPLVEELTPAPEPWSVFERLAGLPHLLFLDSAMPDARLGRYSYLSADPFRVVRFESLAGASGGVPRNPFNTLEEYLHLYRAETVPGLPPFQGGAAGLFGYDLAHSLERLPRPRYDEFRVPDLVLGFYDWVVAFDHRAGRAWLISTGFPERTAERRRRRAARRLREVRQRLRARAAWPRWDPGPRRQGLAPQWPVPGFPGVTSVLDPDQYRAAARRAVEYVHAGDCFQVNLAQRLLYPAVSPPWELYRRLRERNAAPFAGYFDLGDFVLASASPERFVRLEGGEVETRPIKGTRPRGLTPEEDLARREELLHSAKDRAENVMIVDLLRNDLGRVCRYGSVRVPAVCRVESYRYVHHLVSEVRGRLRDGLGPVDLLRAAFPGGSVTGAPKIRAMEIIAELEPVARGAYCGSLGYVGFDGSMDTSILIRTFTLGKGWVQFAVGGGLVADSDPEAEYQETWHKARGLLRALER